MRRFVVGIVILALTFAVCLAVAVAMPRVHAPIAQQLQQAAAAARQGDWTTAQMLTENAERCWLCCRKFTAAVADHEPLEEIDAGFAQILAFLSYGDEREFSAACAALARSVCAMAVSHSLIWWNFL